MNDDIVEVHMFAVRDKSIPQERLCKLIDHEKMESWLVSQEKKKKRVSPLLSWRQRS
jgi:hypothetical protein